MTPAANLPMPAVDANCDAEPCSLLGSSLRSPLNSATQTFLRANWMPVNKAWFQNQQRSKTNGFCRSLSLRMDLPRVSLSAKNFPKEPTLFDTAIYFPLPHWPPGSCAGRLGLGPGAQAVGTPVADSLKGVHDRAILTTLLYHGMRREEPFSRVRSRPSKQAPVLENG